MISFDTRCNMLPLLLSFVLVPAVMLANVNTHVDFTTKGSEGAGGNQAPWPKVVGGLKAEEGQFPFQLSLQWHGKHFCGAVLIQNHFTEETNVALTAGHCVSGIETNDGVPSQASALTVMAGSVSLMGNSSEKQILEVKKIQLHEDYNFPHNDIAVLFLMESFKTGGNVNPAPLPSPIEIYNETVLISGWGKTAEINGDYPDHLQFAIVQIVDNDKCARIYGEDAITDLNMCAGLDLGSVDTCGGDSGGPCVNSEPTVLLGLTSWGKGCARPGFPGVYVRVSAYLPWIQQTIENGSELGK